MNREFRSPPLPWFLAAAAAAVVASFGCKPAQPPAPTAEIAAVTPSPSPPAAEFGAKMDVRVVEVKSDGSTDPDSVKVKKKTQIVVWVLDGDGTIALNFPNNPFPAPPTCDGRFCVALKPPAQDKPAGHYPYTVLVTMGGQAKTSDPDVEVID